MVNDKLVKLIKSLNGAEKRYFSLWITRHYDSENNNTLLLFRDLATAGDRSLKNFTEVNGHRPYARNFRFNKHFLYRQLLRCLHQYHSGRNAEARLKEMQDHADILADKGLYDESLEMLSAASTLALKYECFGIFYEVKRKELELLRDTNYKGVSQEYIRALEQEIAEALSKAAALTKTESAIMQLLYSLAKGGLQRGELPEHARGLSKELKPVKGQKNFRSSLLYYQGMGAVAFAKGNFNQAWKWTGRSLELFERYPHMKEEKQKAWIIANQNHLVTLNYQGKYQNLEHLLEAMESIKASTPQLRSRIFYITHNMVLGTCAQVGDFVRGLKLVREINAALKKQEVQLTLQQMMIFYFNAALVYFGTGRYREANSMIRKILSEKESQRQDLQSFARIFSILIQFESGKQDLLEYSVRSAYRHLAHKKKLYEVEKRVMEFLRDSAQYMGSAQERKTAFTSLKHQLEELKQKRSEQEFFLFFDLIAWLDSKITGKYFGTVLREKNAGYWKR